MVPSVYFALGAEVLRRTGQLVRPLALAERPIDERGTLRPCHVLQVGARGSGFLSHADSSAFRGSPSPLRDLNFQNLPADTSCMDSHPGLTSRVSSEHYTL